MRRDGGHSGQHEGGPMTTSQIMYV